MRGHDTPSPRLRDQQIVLTGVHARRLPVVVGLVGTVLVALAAVVLPPLGGVGASAGHPCASPGASPAASATPSPGGTATPPDRYYHPACSTDPPEPTRADVYLGTLDNGTTVRMRVGQRLGVKLTTPYDSETTWTDVSATGVLYRTRLYAGDSVTDAVFVALQESAGETVTAVTDSLCRHKDTPCDLAPSTWSVTVVVDEPTASPSASPTASEGCYAYGVPAAQPGRSVLTANDAGATVQLRQGDILEVNFGGSCPTGGGYRPAQGEGPLFRQSVSEYQPGATTATFRAVGSGRSTLTATTDAPCLHTSPSCAMAQRLWSVTVDVLPMQCVMSGPASVRSGASVALTGRAAPRATVQVLLRQRGATTFTVRRTVLASDEGWFTTGYTANDDYRWYAVADGCTTTPGLTRVTPWIMVPRYAARGSVVPIEVHGPAGAAVAVYMRAPGGAFRLARTGRLDASGTFRTSYIARTDQRYYAVTGPDRRASTSGVLTQLR